MIPPFIGVVIAAIVIFSLVRLVFVDSPGGTGVINAVLMLLIVAVAVVAMVMAIG